MSLSHRAHKAHLDREHTTGAAALLLADVAVACELSQAGGKDASFADVACLRRYLRANEGDPKKAAAQLAGTLKWRRETRPMEAECPQCRCDSHSHNLRIVGVDGDGRPVLYTCFSQALYRFDSDASMLHFTRTLEDACEVLAHRTARLGDMRVAAEMCVWIIDFHGYNFIADSNPRTAVLAAQLLAHYPERLGRAVMVDAPRVFQATWAAVRRVINEVTASKVCFVRTDYRSLHTEVASWAREPLQSWLLEEIQENRRAASQGGGKAYWVPSLPGGPSKAHDARAAPDFLASPEYALTLTSRLSDSTFALPAPRSPPSASRARQSLWGADGCVALVSTACWLGAGGALALAALGILADNGFLDRWDGIRDGFLGSLSNGAVLEFAVLLIGPSPAALASLLLASALAAAALASRSSVASSATAPGLGEGRFDSAPRWRRQAGDVEPAAYSERVASSSAFFGQEQL